MAGKLLRLAVFGVMAGGAVVSAFAQDAFPDTPANHWAYAGVLRMKQDGLLVGYPDSLFRGTRPASRYEMAVAMHAAYVKLHDLLDAIASQLSGIRTVSPQDVSALKEQIAAVKADIEKLKAYGPDIEALKKASSTFEVELEQLGVDVEAMKKSLGDLSDRTTALERRRPAVDISGDFDLWAGTGNSEGNRPGLTIDGRAIGQSNGIPLGLFKDLAIMEEAAFTFRGTNETGPKWHVTTVASNMLGPTAFGNQSTLTGTPPTGYGFAAANESVYVQDADVAFDTSISGLALTADLGRVAYRQSAYMFQRIDNAPYFTNDRWDDGRYRFDGGILGFNFGNSKLHIIGGNTTNLFSTNGVDVDPMTVSNMRVGGGLSESIFGTSHGYTGPGAVPNPNNMAGDVDHAFGADANIPLGKNGDLSLAYYWFQQEEKYTGFGSANQTDYLEGFKANRDNVFGADVEFGLGRLKLRGGIHQSSLYENGNSANTLDNQAWDVSAIYTSDKWRFWGGYRQVDNNYYAPGDWGRLGIIYNPANIKGWQFGALVAVTPKLRFTATGEWDTGNHTELNNSIFTASPFDGGTTIDSYTARLDYQACRDVTVYASYENTKITDPSTLYFLTNGPVVGDPEYAWTTFGLDCLLGAQTKLNVQYQFSNAGNDIFLPLVGGSNRYTGGFLTTQLTIRF